MVHRRLLTVLAIGAVLGGASAIGGAAGPATKPLTRQQAAQKILDKDGVRLTAPARLALQMIARGDLRLQSGDLKSDSSVSQARRTAEARGGNQERRTGLANVPVNNPGEDSHQTDQTTQSETAIAASGPNIVVGFNDSQTGLLALTAGADLSGYSWSNDGGRSFHDGNQLPNPPGEQNFGDPWLGTDRAGNFYYSTLVSNSDPITGSLGVGVAKSTNGGKTFSPVKRIEPEVGATTLYLGDKDALAVGRDPAAGSRDDVYVAWDDFIVDFNTFTVTNGLPVAHSYDGGATYQVVYASQLVQPSAGCSFSQYIGANPVVDARNGVLYVAAEKIVGNNDACDFPPPPVSFSHVSFKSTDGGQTFGPETLISDVTSSSPTGLFKLGEHQYMRNLEFPSLAVDPAGNAYDSWNDGRSGNSHILIARSSDGGHTWGPAKPVTTGSNDEMQPALSSDGSGLHDLYYKRNADNTLDVVVANSRNGGASWSTKRVTSQSFPGVYTFPQFDPIIGGFYMGDYIANASDGSNQYFTWGDNRNTVTNFLWPQGRNDPDVYFAKQTGQNNGGGE
jgi:hypothetical protein